MFSMKQKQFIASEVEKLLLGLGHPEMPKKKPEFHLHVNGEQAWSWADIEPNHHYETKEPGVNPWNEAMDKTNPS